MITVLGMPGHLGTDPRTGNDVIRFAVTQDIVMTLREIGDVYITEDDLVMDAAYWIVQSRPCDEAIDDPAWEDDHVQPAPSGSTWDRASPAQQARPRWTGRFRAPGKQNRHGTSLRR